MKIKICGLKRDEDVDIVNRYLPDMAGFVFAGTKRRIDAHTARRLSSRLDDRIVPVGVFVDADVECAASLAECGAIRMIQLHGNEDAEYISRLRERLGSTRAAIIKAARVRCADDAAAADALPVDLLLLDAYREGEMGGSGETFDHSLIPPLAHEYILAGGISPQNAASAVRAIASRGGRLPVALDVSSAVETDGAKDDSKVRDMVRAARDLTMIVGI